MNEYIVVFFLEILYELVFIFDVLVVKCMLFEFLLVKDKMSEDVKDDLEFMVVFFDIVDCEFYERIEGDGEVVKSYIGEGSKSNENEVEIVVRWVRKLVCCFIWLINVSLLYVIDIIGNIFY